MGYLSQNTYSKLNKLYEQRKTLGSKLSVFLDIEKKDIKVNVEFFLSFHVIRFWNHRILDVFIPILVFSNESGDKGIIKYKNKLTALLYLQISRRWRQRVTKISA